MGAQQADQPDRRENPSAGTDQIHRGNDRPDPLIRKNAADICDRKPGILTDAVVRLMPKGTTEH